MCNFAGGESNQLSTRRSWPASSRLMDTLTRSQRPKNDQLHGVGKIGFELWRMEQFSVAQLERCEYQRSGGAPPAISSQIYKIRARAPPLMPATNGLTTLQMTNSQFFDLPSPARNRFRCRYQVKNSNQLVKLTVVGITQQFLSNDQTDYRTGRPSARRQSPPSSCGWNHALATRGFGQR